MIGSLCICQPIKAIQLHKSAQIIVLNPLRSFFSFSTQIIKLPQHRIQTSRFLTHTGYKAFDLLPHLFRQRLIQHRTHLVQRSCRQCINASLCLSDLFLQCPAAQKQAMIRWRDVHTHPAHPRTLADSKQ